MANGPYGRSKSGDSTLQDAQDARETERKKGGTWDEKENRESLMDEVQDAAEKKRAAGDLEGAAKTELALEKLAKAFEALENRISRVESTPAVPAPTTVGKQKQLMKCPTCRQTVHNKSSGRGVCAGLHAPVMVAPAEMDMRRGFPGIQWNGVNYIGHCLLPLTIVDAVMVSVRRWEHRERRKFIKGGKIFGDLSTGQLTVAPII